MKRCVTWFLVFSLAFVLVGGVQAQNLLLNGDLEDPLPPKSGDDDPVDWTLDEGSLNDPPDTINTAELVGFNPQSGFQHIWLRSFETFNQANPAYAHLSQSVAGSAGMRYTMTGWAFFENGYSGGVVNLNDPAVDPPLDDGPVSPTDTFFAIEFLNAGNAMIGSQQIELKAEGQLNDATWREYSVSAVAPSGTARVKVRASMVDAVINFGVEPQSAFLDNFSLTAEPAGIDADFNDDGSLNCADVNSLTATIAAGSNNAAFDLTGDGNVNLSDLDQWRLDAGSTNIGPGRAYRNGDANLDGVVDGSDFGIWNSNKFTNKTEWCLGNFNADTVVDGSDFGIWNSNKFTASDGSVVPEPAAASLVGILLLGALGARRSR